MNEIKRIICTELKTETFLLYLYKENTECKITTAKQRQPARTLTRNSKLNLPISGDKKILSEVLNSKFNMVNTNPELLILTLIRNLKVLRIRLTT